MNTQDLNRIDARAEAARADVLTLVREVFRLRMLVKSVADTLDEGTDACEDAGSLFDLAKGASETLTEGLET